MRNFSPKNFRTLHRGYVKKFLRAMIYSIQIKQPVREKYDLFPIFKKWCKKSCARSVKTFSKCLILHLLFVDIPKFPKMLKILPKKSLEHLKRSSKINLGKNLPIKTKFEERVFARKKSKFSQKVLQPHNFS